MQPVSKQTWLINSSQNVGKKKIKKNRNEITNEISIKVRIKMTFFF